MTHPNVIAQFSQGTRVRHQFHKSTGTVVGKVRTNRGGSLADDVEVRFDDGQTSFCHLDFMTVVAPVEHAAYHGDTKPHQQLLNELYHDRARLESAVDNAVTLASDIIDFENGRTLMPEARELFGRLKQFVTDNE